MIDRPYLRFSTPASERMGPSAGLSTRSMPALKNLPSPLNITTLTSLLYSAHSKAVTRSCIVAPLRALAFLGLLYLMIEIVPSRETVRFSSLGDILLLSVSCNIQEDEPRDQNESLAWLGRSCGCSRTMSSSFRNLTSAERVFSRTRSCHSTGCARKKAQI